MRGSGGRGKGAVGGGASEKLTCHCATMAVIFFKKIYRNSVFSFPARACLCVCVCFVELNINHFIQKTKKE